MLSRGMVTSWYRCYHKLRSFTVLHFVITGYVAINTDGVAVTLKRDGSDYSAAIMGKILRANSISIWTDVDGVLSADPRRVPLVSRELSVAVSCSS